MEAVGGKPNSLAAWWRGLSVAWQQGGLVVLGGGATVTVAVLLAPVASAAAAAIAAEGAVVEICWRD